MSANRIEQLKSFLESSPNDPFLNYAMALEHLKINEEKKALDIFVTLTAQHPNYVGTYYHLGQLQERLEQQETALATYQKGITVARKLGDHHSLAELQTVYNNLLDELE